MIVASCCVKQASLDVDSCIWCCSQIQRWIPLQLCIIKWQCHLNG